MNRRWPAVALGLALVAIGCGADEADDTDAVSVGAITVEDAWMRPTPGTGGTTAAYMTITNGGDEAQTLLAATSAACGVTELHMSAEEDGVMTMSPLTEGVTIGPKSSVILGPGALHVMCLDVTTELEEGTTTELTMEFADGSAVVVEAEVRKGQGAP